MGEMHSDRRALLRLGTGVVGGLALAAGATLDPRQAAAQAAPGSLLRTVLDRGHLIVGTGSTNAPWHFENDKGELVGMDIAMARILAKGLFDDDKKVEYVRQDPAARIPNIVTGKIDITIQFMTVSPNRAQFVNFTRPYYVEGIALLTRPERPTRVSTPCWPAATRPRSRSCRTSMPRRVCTRCCRRRLSSSSIPRPT